MMKPADIIAAAMKATAEKQRKENEQRVAVALEAFTQARDAHTASMKKLYDTEAAIRRSEQEGRLRWMKARKRSRAGAAGSAVCAVTSPRK